MTKEVFNQVCMQAVEELRNRAPIDTGNLRHNAIRYEWIDEDTFQIYVDGSPDNPNSIAPYMPYTNEPWLSPKWKGKKNPNEAWWQEAVEYIAEYIADQVNGDLDKD